MNAERARIFLLTLPHVVETMQWGEHLVFWVGDKHLGGKMFVLISLDSSDKAVISYPAGPERFLELIESEDLFPAPYFARIFWVASHTWSALSESAWQAEFRAAHALVLEKLPPRVRTTLALPASQRKRMIMERKRLLAARKAETAADISR